MNKLIIFIIVILLLLGLGVADFYTSKGQLVRTPTKELDIIVVDTNSKEYELEWITNELILKQAVIDEGEPSCDDLRVWALDNHPYYLAVDEVAFLEVEKDRLEEELNRAVGSVTR